MKFAAVTDVDRNDEQCKVAVVDMLKLLTRPTLTRVVVIVTTSKQVPNLAPC